MRELFIHSPGELFAVGAFNTLRLCDKSGVSIATLHMHVQLHRASKVTYYHSFFGHTICGGILCNQSFSCIKPLLRVVLHLHFIGEVL